MAELDVGGIFFPPFLLCMVLGFTGRILLSRILEATGAYRLIWHRPIFDTSLFLIITGVLFFLTSAQG